MPVCMRGGCREGKRRCQEGKRKTVCYPELRTNGLQDPSLRNYTFDQDFGDNPLLDKARAYVENWDEFKAQNRISDCFCLAL